MRDPLPQPLPTRGRGAALAIRLACCAALLLAAPALAGPKTITDCEAIKDANAYNLCLASFGPMRGQHGANYPGVATEGEKGTGEKGALASSGKGVSNGGSATRHNGHGHSSRAGVRRGPSGRVRMEFSPSGR